MYTQQTVTDAVATDTPEINNGAIISDTVEETPVLVDTVTAEEPPQPTVVTPNAPLGLTKFGNPKRDRSNHKK